MFKVSSNDFRNRGHLFIFGLCLKRFLESVRRVLSFPSFFNKVFSGEKVKVGFKRGFKVIENSGSIKILYS
jgi:hypothetical protein